MDEEDFDDALMEYKDTQKPSKAQFETLFATGIFVLPRLRGRLHWTMAAVRRGGR